MNTKKILLISAKYNPNTQRVTLKRSKSKKRVSKIKFMTVKEFLGLDTTLRKMIMNLSK